MKISIAGLSRALVVAGLYNAALPYGRGFLRYDPTPLTEADVDLPGSRIELDYVKGRCLKCEIDGDVLEVGAYDRETPGKAQRVIDSLRATGDPNNEVIRALHGDPLFLSET